MPKTTGMGKGGPSSNSTFGSRPTIKLGNSSIKIKPKQSLLQMKSEDTLDARTGKENITASCSKQGNSQNFISFEGNQVGGISLLRSMITDLFF